MPETVLPTVPVTPPTVPVTPPSGLLTRSCWSGGVTGGTLTVGTLTLGTLTGSEGDGSETPGIGAAAAAGLRRDRGRWAALTTGVGVRAR